MAEHFYAKFGGLGLHRFLRHSVEKQTDTTDKCPCKSYSVIPWVKKIQTQKLKQTDTC